MIQPMPDTRSPEHARLILEFVSAVIRHWKVFITGGIIAGALWVLQGIGWLAPHPWAYGTGDSTQKTLANTYLFHRENRCRLR